MVLETTVRILIITDDTATPVIDGITRSHQLRDQIQKDLHQAIRNTTYRHSTILSVHIDTEKSMHQIT